MTTLGDLYDGDKALTSARIRRLRGLVKIPHPLYEVQYADGVLPDTTAGRVRTLPWLKRRTR